MIGMYTDIAIEKYTGVGWRASIAVKRGSHSCITNTGYRTLGLTLVQVVHFARNIGAPFAVTVKGKQWTTDQVLAKVKNQLTGSVGEYEIPAFEKYIKETYNA